MLTLNALPAPRRRLRLWPSLLLLLASLPAPAQTDPKRPDPLDPQARVPALVYRPSLPAAKGAADDPPIPWPAANDRVGRIGGWRVYALEAVQPVPPVGTAAAPPPAAAASRPAPAPSPALKAPAGQAASPADHSGHSGHAKP